jgi:cytochrome c oxidase cbb3-type subunit 3/ubiquinol-cytochrome c reductase cytochrome c subunit
VPDGVLADVIARGRPGTPMPAFARGAGGPLTDAQLKVLAEGLKPRWGPASPPAGAIPAYAGEGKSGDRGRGARVFEKACAGCHGDEGEGMDDVAGAIKDRAFLALISDQALRRLIITGRPDLGMPSFRDNDGRTDPFRPLTGAEIDDLVALLAHWRDAKTE